MHVISIMLHFMIWRCI